jgi:hypothetical protein
MTTCQRGARSSSHAAFLDQFNFALSEKSK